MLSSAPWPGRWRERPDPTAQRPRVPLQWSVSRPRGAAVGGGDRGGTGIDPPQDVAARDDAHLRSLGITPQLNRTLGFLANFALAFSFISVSTGSFGNFGVGLGLGGPA